MLKRAADGKVYYGWYITVTLAITETISWGIMYYAFSVFLAPMETDLGWSRTELTGAFSLALLIAGGMAFPVGAWIDRHGARLLMTVGSIGATALVIAWSQVHDLTSFYLIWAGLGVCMAAVLYEPAFTVIATWFVTRRSTALALVTFAAGLASTIFVPSSDMLLGALGWRDAVLALGIFLGITTIPLHLLVLRRRPADVGALPDGLAPQDARASARLTGATLREALSSQSFWLLTAAFSLSALAAAAIRVHFIPFLLDSGVESSTAALASGSIGIMQVAGRLVFAPLDTRLSGKVMVGGVFLLQAVALVVLLGSAAVWAIGVFIVIFGAAYGARTLARPSIIASLYGATHYGRISSVMAIFLTLAGTAAPVGAGLLYDQFGSYNPVLWLLVAMTLVSVAIIAIVKPDGLTAPTAESVSEGSAAA